MPLDFSLQKTRKSKKHFIRNTPSKVFQIFGFTVKLQKVLNTYLYRSILLFRRKLNMLSTPSSNAPSMSYSPSKFYQKNQKVLVWEFFNNTRKFYETNLFLHSISVNITKTYFRIWILGQKLVFIAHKFLKKIFPCHPIQVDFLSQRLIIFYLYNLSN